MTLKQMKAKGMIVEGTALEILELVVNSKGSPWSLRELAEFTGTYHSNVEGHVDRLERHRLVKREPVKARTLRATVRFIPVEQLGSTSNGV